jgi:hypothetical protein
MNTAVLHSSGSYFENGNIPSAFMKRNRLSNYQLFMIDYFEWVKFCC